MEIGHCLLDGNADAVEFCPHDSFRRVLAASTYTLQEGDHPSRSGSISLFNVDAESRRLQLFHRVETAGIFDIKWSPGGAGGAPLLAQADADGYLRVHHLDCCSDVLEDRDLLDTLPDGGNCLKEVSGEQVSSSMCLCLDWNPSATSISVGLSDGSLSIISLMESKLDIQQEWKAHEFELWATTFDIYQPQLVYTGSDDCKFSCWDLRDCPSNFVFQNSKIHKMGVCCITKSPSNSHMLFTGSYDEYLRVWDVRSISKPVNETSICLGGGVWRIKHHPSVPGLLLAACMHNGFAVVKIKGEKAEVIETYNKHGSLAYGADWQRGEVCQEGKSMSGAVATCSFYDQLLRIWMPESDLEI
ncbi:hypothetical protein Vadar_003253 [Vaccinium darrowii]|uniref:Uncharacterized protein n=1 Tax=Vaccinium darrowii TaxID=229202 RepID=A0ACB7YSY5_9ERIC|nr:hypothetical protein Vadar_003253 [Vaccinium darrowii]